MVATSGLTWSLLLLASSTYTEALSLHNKKVDTSGQIGSKDLLHSRGILPPRQSNDSEPVPDTWVSLPLDHFGDDERVFDNRYWVSASGYEPGGPVFIYDNGEGAGDGSYVEEGWFKDIVDSFGGIGISWEHRYYGESAPVNISTETDAEDLKFLTVEQALADVAVFASNFSLPGADFEDVDLTPASTPWIFVGGSYPGIRAALMRELYPEIIYASYASSAPVQARVNMSTYFDPIWEGAHAYGYGNCTRDVHAAILHIDSLLEQDDASAAAVKKLFLGRGGDKNSHGDFAQALSAIWFDWQNYGAAGTVAQFCEYLETRETANGTHVTAGAHGWAKSLGAAWVMERWAEWEYMPSLVGGGCEGNEKVADTAAALSARAESDGEGEGADEEDSEPECDLSSRYDDADTIAWTWQYCTQFGFLQVANVGPRQLASKFNDIDYQLSLCRRQFPDAGDLLPDVPDVDALNELTGGWDARPSNTFWTGGEFDPWRTLSPLADEGVDAPLPALTLQAPGCNVSTSVHKIFGYVLPNAQHCYDLDATEEGYKVQGYFTDALTEWLKCFKPADGGY